MYAYSPAVPQLERTAYEAFDIAWNFLDASDQAADVTATQAFIATVIMDLLQRGERNKIKLANLAISAFQNSPETERKRLVMSAGYN